MAATRLITMHINKGKTIAQSLGDRTDYVHNHIIFNSTTLDCTHKFNNYKDSAEVVREISDRLCLENDLSIIENPTPKGKHYAEWKAERQGISWKAKLRKTIDDIFPGCTDFDHFLKRMESAGYEVKHGKYISFRAPGQERFTRAKTLGTEYAEDVLRAKISGAYVPAIGRKKVPKAQDRRVAFIIDIQQKIAEGKGAAYEKWAKVFNLKESAKALNFFTEHGLTSMEELDAKAEAASADFNRFSDRLKLSEARMREIKELKTQIINYGETRNTYAAYRNAKRPGEFYEQHREDIEMHLAAKRAFNELGVKKLPSLAQLNAEFLELSAQRKAQYEDYRKAKIDMLEWARRKTIWRESFGRLIRKSIRSVSDDGKKGADSRSFFMGFGFSQQAKTRRCYQW
ncbi:MAG: relaxase/mobilization nuclease domain-containing protein [Oscillospiraceae bacterium]|nr:relaxase/mobilization nuclease domain-containing protein [Oscillospiraceae bacterium]